MMHTTGRMLAAEDTWGSEKESQAQSTHSHPGPVRLDDTGGRASWRLSVVEQGQGPPALNSSFFHISVRS